MADSAETSSDPQVNFKVKTSGDSNHNITMAESATVLDLKNKLSGADFENIPVERQRLIYSGRVMKNEEPLSTYKIKAGNTVHLVKSAASNPSPAAANPASSSTPSAPQIPTNMAAGTANNPLAGLTGARYAGLTNLPSADMFGPDGGMVGNHMDEEQLANMLSNPNVMQQMNEMMNNDAFLDMMIQQNPMLRNNPNAREILRSPMMRHMMTNPDAIRSAARMRRAMGGGNGQNSFPMPGVTDNNPNAASGGAGANSGSGAGAAADPFNLAALGGAGNNAANPFGGLFGMPPFMPPAQGPTGQTQTGTGDSTQAAARDQASGDNQTSAASGTANTAAANPFASLFGMPVPGGTGAGAGADAGASANANPFNMFGQPMTPESLQQLQQMAQMFGMGGQGAPAASAPADNRPPEERYAEQLRQLNDMGFYDFDRNVAALRRSGGSVQGAIEHLLSSV